MCVANTCILVKWNFNTISHFNGIVPPNILDIESTPSSVAVRENQNINMTCRADGFPTPKIIWRRYAIDWNSFLILFASFHSFSACRMEMESIWSRLLWFIDEWKYFLTLLPNTTITLVNYGQRQKCISVQIMDFWLLSFNEPFSFFVFSLP